MIKDVDIHALGMQRNSARCVGHMAFYKRLDVIDNLSTGSSSSSSVLVSNANYYDSSVSATTLLLFFVLSHARLRLHEEQWPSWQQPI